MEIKLTAENTPLLKLFLSIVTFFLSYVRNTFFIFSATMIFFLIVVMQIFLQDEAGVNFMAYFFSSLDNVPVIKNYISTGTELYVDENALRNFFLFLSFVFTILTETIYYFMSYIFKIIPEKMQWNTLKTRMFFVFTSLTVMYIFVFGYIVWKINTVSDVVFIFIIFWFLGIASSLLFLLFDYLSKATKMYINKSTR